MLHCPSGLETYNMAPRSSRASGADTDTSMVDEPIRQLPVDPMVSTYTSALESNYTRGRRDMHRGPWACRGLTFGYRMSTRLQTTQKTLIQIQTPPPVALLVSLSIPMDGKDDPKQPNCVEVFLERSMIYSANQRYVTYFSMAREDWGKLLTHF